MSLKKEIINFIQEKLGKFSEEIVKDTKIVSGGKVKVEYEPFFRDVKFGKTIRFVDNFLKDKEWTKEKVASYKKMKLEDTVILGMIQKDAMVEDVFEGKNTVYVSTTVFKKDGHPWKDIVKKLLEGRK